MDGSHPSHSSVTGSPLTGDGYETDDYFLCISGFCQSQGQCEVGVGSKKKKIRIQNEKLLRPEVLAKGKEV